MLTQEEQQKKIDEQVVQRERDNIQAGRIYLTFLMKKTYEEIKKEIPLGTDMNVCFSDGSNLIERAIENKKYHLVPKMLKFGVNVSLKLILKTLKQLSEGKITLNKKSIGMLQAIVLQFNREKNGEISAVTMREWRRRAFPKSKKPEMMTGGGYGI